VLVEGPRGFTPFVTIPSVPTPPPLTLPLFLDFLVFFSTYDFFVIYLEPVVIWPSSKTLTSTVLTHCALQLSKGGLPLDMFKRIFWISEIFPTRTILLQGLQGIMPS